MVASYGWLIVNRFLYTDKFIELYEWLIKAAKSKNIEIKLVTNTEIIVKADDNKPIYDTKKLGIPDFIIFWDKDIRLARSLEAAGYRLFNCADAIMACDDKSMTASCLSGIVRMPATYDVPFTYEHLGYNNLEFLNIIESLLTYPFIIKECFGSFGAQVYMVNNRADCENILGSVNGKPCIVQEYIKSSHGKDIRINVVGNNCVTAMLRYNDSDFRANITGGGLMKPYTPTKEECEMAISVCNALKLDFAGVDILFGEDGPVLCEVNSNAHFKNIYDCTGVNVADEIIKHIMRCL